MPPRCVKCAGDHLSKECLLTKESNTRPKCCNCLGEHTANYSQCPTLLDFLTKTNSRKQPRAFDSKPVSKEITFAQTVNSQDAKQFPPLPNKNNNLNNILNSQTQVNPMSEFQQLQQEIKKINEKHNISRLLENVRKLGQALDNCSSEAEKTLVMFNFLK